MSDKKYYSKNIPPACAYCANGRALSGGEEIFCMKKGIVSAGDSCRSYKYDVLKRIPAVKDIGRNYKDEDFKL